MAGSSDARLYGAVLGVIGVLAVAATVWIYTANLTYYGGGPIRSDGVGYYVYLPALFLDHDLTMRRTGARSFGGDPAYIPGVRWVRTTVPAGYPGQHMPLDQFGIGEAVLDRALLRDRPCARSRHGRAARRVLLALPVRGGRSGARLHAARARAHGLDAAALVRAARPCCSP